MQTNLVSIPEVTAAVVANAHRATQGMQQVIACLATAMGTQAPEEPIGKPRSIPEAVAGFASTAAELAEAFGSVADLFEQAGKRVASIEATRKEQPALPAPETITTPQDWSIVQEPEPEPEAVPEPTRPEPVENEPTPEPEPDPEVESASHEAANRIEDYLEPSANGTGRGKKPRKGGK